METLEHAACRNTQSSTRGLVHNDVHSQRRVNPLTHPERTSGYAQSRNDDDRGHVVKAGLVSRITLRPRIGRESRNRTLQVVTRAGAS